MPEKNWQLKCATQQDVSGLIHRLRLTLAKKDEEMKMLVTITKSWFCNFFSKLEVEQTFFHPNDGSPDKFSG